MAAPPTIGADGYYVATRAGSVVGEATLRMKTATQGKLAFGGLDWKITGDPSKKKLRGTAAGSVADLKIVNRRVLNGTVDGEKVEMTRAMLRPLPAAEMAQSDPGPTGTMTGIMDGTPDYQAAVGDQTTFWYAVGPGLFRGRLDQADGGSVSRS